MGMIDEVRELDRQISGQLQQSALAHEVVRAWATSTASASPFKKHTKGSRRNEQKSGTFFSRVSRRSTRTPESEQWMQPSTDAIEFILRAYATPAFRGLMQDLAAYDR